MPTLVVLSPVVTVHVADAETVAGTLIANTATVKVRGAEGEWTVQSNPATFLVAERLDVLLVRADDGRVSVAPGGVAVAVLLTNRGNGSEAFGLTATLSDATAKVRSIAIDRDGDGRFDPAIDTPLTDARTPALDPGASLRLLVIVDPAAADVTAAALSVTARAATGSGPAGTLFAGRGDGGGDAITGSTGALATVAIPLGDGPGIVPILFKSQSVRAPNGSSVPASGAIVTYRLEARFAAATVAARIDDPIPQGTTYVPGSLMLDAARLTDAEGDDAGSADADAVRVSLGDVAGAATRTVQFQVTIQ